MEERCEEEGFRRAETSGNHWDRADVVSRSLICAQIFEVSFPRRLPNLQHMKG